MGISSTTLYKQIRMATGILLVMLVATACNNSRKTATKSVALPALTISAKKGISQYRHSATRHWDILHTEVSLHLHLREKAADGDARLLLRPYFYTTDTLILDAGNMHIQEIVHQEYTLPETDWEHKNGKLRIQLPQQYHRNDTISLRIRYTATPYKTNTGGSKAITEGRGLYFINTDLSEPGKPMQVWTQGEPESNSGWLPTIDAPNERFTFRLHLTIPDSFTSLATGNFTGSVPAGNGLRTDTWDMDMPVQPYALMLAAGVFSVVRDTPWNGKEIQYYLEPAYAPYARAIFGHTPEMIQYFSDITGVPYPWNKYSQIVVRDFVSGAMENTTASLYGEFMNQNLRELADKNYEDVIAHELFHQWFGDYVTTESWAHINLNEAFANYSQQLWRHHKYGSASRDEQAVADLALYLNQAAYFDPPLVRFEYQAPGDVFDRVSYQKGGAILRYIHGLAGDTAFFLAMKAYLTSNALQPAETSDWRKALELATGRDWRWFFNQWYDQGGHPQLHLRYQYDDTLQELLVHATQTQDDEIQVYHLPLKAILIYGDSTAVIDWTVAERDQSFRFPYVRGIKPVFVPDATHWLPGILTEQKQPEVWLQQFRTAGDHFISKQRAVRGAFLHQRAAPALAVFREALNDPADGIRFQALTLLQRISGRLNWRDSLQVLVFRIAEEDSSHRARAAAWLVLGKWKHLPSLPAMIKALNDSSYMAAGAALEALQHLDGDTARYFALRLRENDPRAHLETAIWQVLAFQGAKADIAVYEVAAPGLYGRRRAALAEHISLYALYTADSTAYIRSLKLLLDMASTEKNRKHRQETGKQLVALYLRYKAYQDNNEEKNTIPQLTSRLEWAKRYSEKLKFAEPDPEVRQHYEQMEKNEYQE